MRAFIFCFAMFMGWFSNANANNNPQHENKMVAVALVMQDGDDQKVVATIYTSLMTAEKVAKMMDIQVNASESVTDGILVFSLKSETEREMTMKMFDEEGFETTAHRVFEVYEGNNYRALNVQSLEDGTYMFQITDPEGNEHKQKVVISGNSINM